MNIFQLKLNYLNARSCCFKILITSQLRDGVLHVRRGISVNPVVKIRAVFRVPTHMVVCVCRISSVHSRSHPCVLRVGFWNSAASTITSTTDAALEAQAQLIEGGKFLIQWAFFGLEDQQIKADGVPKWTCRQSGGCCRSSKNKYELNWFVCLCLWINIDLSWLLIEVEDGDFVCTRIGAEVCNCMCVVVDWNTIWNW